MAFCNSCGASLEADAKFCVECGAALPATAASTNAAPAPAPPTPSSSTSGLKMVLIVVAILVGLGILGSAAVGFFVWRVARHSRVETSGENVRIQTPLGTVEAGQKAEQAARNMGVDLYPGARVLGNGAAAMSMGGMKTVALELESDDPPQNVAWFYKRKFPRATFSESQADHYAIVSSTEKGLTTVSIVPHEGKTRIHIAVVGGKPPAGDDEEPAP